MKSGKTRSILPWIYAGSVVAHVAFAAVAVVLPKPERSEAVAIELADIKKKAAPKPPPPPPPPPKEDKPKPLPRPAAQARAKVAAEPVKTEAEPPPLDMGADGFADLGSVALGGGGEGVAIPLASAPAPGAAVRSSVAPRAAARKVEQLAPTVATTCNEPMRPPRSKTPVSPKYTMEARQAEIEGVVRIEVTVDESGRVIAARVLTGLGYGLDESAMKAAREAQFEPATQCGRPVISKKILKITFELT